MCVCALKNLIYGVLAFYALNKKQLLYFVKKKLILNFVDFFPIVFNIPYFIVFSFFSNFF